MSPETIVVTAILAALAILDGASTYYVLKHGGREMNPVVNLVIARLGRYTGLMFVKIAVFAIGAYSVLLDPAIINQFVFKLSTAIYAMVVAWNLIKVRETHERLHPESY